MFLRQQAAGVIAGRAGKVSMDVDTTRHHDHAWDVERWRAGRQVGDNTAVLDAHVADFAVDVVGRVVHGAADDSQPLWRRHQVLAPGVTAPATLRSTAAADAGPVKIWESGSGTSSMRYPMPGS